MVCVFELAAATVSPKCHPAVAYFIIRTFVRIYSQPALGHVGCAIYDCFLTADLFAFQAFRPQTPRPAIWPEANRLGDFLSRNLGFRRMFVSPSQHKMGRTETSSLLTLCYYYLQLIAAGNLVGSLLPSPQNRRSRGP